MGKSEAGVSTAQYLLKNQQDRHPYNTELTQMPKVCCIDFNFK